MVKKILVLAIFSVAMVLFLSPATFGEVPKSIKIGGAVSLTGKFASGGIESKFGYEQAVADINKNGGVFC